MRSQRSRSMARSSSPCTGPREPNATGARPGRNLVRPLGVHDLAAKIFRLRPSDPASWLSPAEVVAQLRKVFDHVSADTEGARKLGDRFLSKYRMLLQAGLGDKNSTPLEIVERQ